MSASTTVPSSEIGINHKGTKTQGRYGQFRVQKPETRVQNCRTESLPRDSKALMGSGPELPESAWCTWCLGGSIPGPRPGRFDAYPGPEWMTNDDYDALHHRHRCPDCWNKVLASYSDRLTPMPAARRTLVLFMHFRNVRRDGTVKDGGLEFFFCPDCRVEYAHGPSFEGGYRLLRLP